MRYSPKAAGQTRRNGDEATNEPSLITAHQLALVQGVETSMGYYMRVFAKSDAAIPVSQLEQRLRNEGLDAKIMYDEGEEANWTKVTVTHPDGIEIADIEKLSVEPGRLGEEELAEFVEESQTVEPASAAEWLTNALSRIRVIYFFQILRGTDQGHGWEAVYAIQDELRKPLGGILHADLEGFSNEEGDQITWEFSSRATGLWNMAVLGEDGRWIPFQMDLGNEEHREAFCAGRVPSGVKP